MEDKWISVKDRLPEKEIGVLAYLKTKSGIGGAVETSMFIDDEFLIYHPEDYDVTHWMPLPAPPTNQS